jgi:hypothetical protein
LRNYYYFDDLNPYAPRLIKAPLHAFIGQEMALDGQRCARRRNGSYARRPGLPYSLARRADDLVAESVETERLMIGKSPREGKSERHRRGS